jgi:hypothetical protein
MPRISNLKRDERGRIQPEIARKNGTKRERLQR